MKSDKEHRIDKDNVACVCKEMYIVIDISTGHRELKFRSKGKRSRYDVIPLASDAHSL